MKANWADEIVYWNMLLMTSCRKTIQTQKLVGVEKQGCPKLYIPEEAKTTVWTLALGQWEFPFVNEDGQSQLMSV